MAGRVMVLALPFIRHEPEAGYPLREAGVKIEHGPTDAPAEDELIELLEGFDTTIASVEPYTREVFNALPDLRTVARWGVGYDNIDLAAATAANVVVTNTPGAVTQAVADQTLALMLALLRRVPEQTEVARSLQWRWVEGHELWRKTLGIVGFGSIGQAVARRACGFAMRILASDVRDISWQAGEIGARPVALEELLAEADVVTLHATLTEESRGMIGAEELDAMKPGAVLINCGRGGLVDQSALARALHEGRIAGAALDTFEEEPPDEDDPILSAPNTIITPHNSSATVEAAERVNETVCENVLAVLNGRRPRFTVNPEVFSPM